MIESKTNRSFYLLRKEGGDLRAQLHENDSIIQKTQFLGQFQAIFVAFFGPLHG